MTSVSKYGLAGLATLALFGLVAGGCQAQHTVREGGTGDAVEVRVVDLSRLSRLDDIVPALVRSRVVVVGESHDRYDHHLSQLAVIQALHERGLPLAVGMEFFQQPYQGALDDYVAGRIEERELLTRTEYYDRWRFDYRLYRPILRYARENGIPLVALNVPAELTSKVGKVGLQALSPDERATLPADIDRSDERYHERLRAVFSQHPGSEAGTFERWLDVQLVWDEGMAERAARYLGENPGRTLVVLAGSGHVAYRSGIPNRIARRAGVPVSVVLPVDAVPLDPAAADFLIASREEALPPAGRLGAHLETKDGVVTVRKLEPDSGARAAGVKDGDRLLSVDGTPIGGFVDVKLTLMDRRPGESVRVEVRRDRWVGRSQDLAFDVTLR
jgi:uncharacterized iron-regulated protein